MEYAVWLIFIPFVIAHDLSSPPASYVDVGEPYHFIPTSLSPSIICRRNPHWVTRVVRVFQRQSIIISSTSSNAFPLHAYLSSNEIDLHNRAPWLHPIASIQPSLSFSIFQPTTAQVNHDPGFYELLEQTVLILPSLDSDCVAFILPPGRSSFDHFPPIRVNVAFEGRLDWSRIWRLTIGLAAYMIAPMLSKNLTFYYLSGVGMSVIGSLLIILLVGMRLFPKRTSLVLQGIIVIGGGAFSLFVLCLDYLRSAMLNFVSKNAGLVICYVLLMSLLSSAILYWLSLPERLIKNFPRTQTMLKLIIRTIGVLLIASAPQLPIDFPAINKLGVHIADLIETKLNVDVTVAMPPTSVLIRLIFAAVVVVLLSFLPDFRSSRRDHMHHHAHSEHILPPIPCAASSPIASNGTRPFWKPPGSGYRESSTPKTTSYGGYSYDEYVRVNGHDRDYCLSPVRASRTSAYTTPNRCQPMMNSPRSHNRRRSQVGWTVTQEAILTDDEDEDY